jgi:hypothetical protein
MKIEDLESNEIVNEDVRYIDTTEKMLGSFIILNRKIICLTEVSGFILNEKPLSCDSLQEIKVGKNYTIKKGNETYSHMQKTLSHTKEYKLERGIYKDVTSTLPNFSTKEHFSLVDTLFLDKIGQISHAKSATFGIVMFLVSVTLLGALYYKCPCCRDIVHGCFLLCTPQCLTDKMERRAIRQLQEEETRQLELRNIDENITNHMLERAGADRNGSNVIQPGTTTHPQRGVPT